MKRFLGYLKPFWPGVSMVLALVLLQALADLALPSLMAEIVDQGITKGDTALIWRTGGSMLLVALAGTICAIGSGYLSARISTAYGSKLRQEMFVHAISLGVDDFEGLGTSSLITRTTNDINQIQMVVLMSLRMVVMTPMMFVGGIVMAVSKDPRLSRVLFYVLPVIAVGIYFVSKKGFPLFKAIQEKLDKLNLVLREGLTGVRVIRAFNRVDYESKRFDEANKDLAQTSVRVNRIMTSLMPLMTLTLNFMTIAIIWVGSRRIDAGYLEVGGLMAFIQYAMQILMSLIFVSMIFVILPRASASALRIEEVLEIDTETNPVGAVYGEMPQTQNEQKGFVEFRNVTFSYPGAEKPVLSGLSFEAKPGEVTAIIGGTGSGKSTLISLIPRFYEVDGGEILIDGMDIKEISYEDLRKKIGLVPQKAVLFTGSVADNIRHGKEDASDEEVKKAAQIAQALGFINQMSEGFDSLIAQGGTNVSGGQKQRLCIARALVRRPEIYIFDDSFSALDFKTDSRLRAALKEQIGDSTVFLVAQRVSTVLDADRILVIDQGKIVGNGTHEELLERCVVYKEIVLSQLSEEELS